MVRGQTERKMERDRERKVSPDGGTARGSDLEAFPAPLPLHPSGRFPASAAADSVRSRPPPLLRDHDRPSSNDRCPLRITTSHPGLYICNQLGLYYGVNVVVYVTRIKAWAVNSCLRHNLSRLSLTSYGVYARVRDLKDTLLPTLCPLATRRRRRHRASDGKLAPHCKH